MGETTNTRDRESEWKPAQTHTETNTLSKQLGLDCSKISLEIMQISHLCSKFSCDAISLRLIVSAFYATGVLNPNESIFPCGIGLILPA